MINSVLADVGTFFQQYWIIFVLLALIIVMYVISFVRRKKYSEQTAQMQNELKPGVKVKTYSGFYGKIISIKETTDGKVALLEMGEGNKIGYITVDVNAIYGVDQKEEVVYDKDGNIIVKENRAKKDDKTEDDKKQDDEKPAKPQQKVDEPLKEEAETLTAYKNDNSVKEYQTFEEKKASKKEKKQK